MSIDGVELGKLYSGYFFEVSVPPGTHVIDFEGNFFNFPGPKQAISVDVGANQAAFIELVILPGGGPAVVAREYHMRREPEARQVLTRLTRASGD